MGWHMHRDIFFVLISSLNWGQDVYCIYLSLCIRIFAIYTLILIPGIDHEGMQLSTTTGTFRDFSEVVIAGILPNLFVSRKKMKCTKCPTQRFTHDVYTCIFIMISFNDAFAIAKLSEHVSILENHQRCHSWAKSWNMIRISYWRLSYTLPFVRPIDLPNSANIF